MASETITFTRDEFVAFVQRVQDLAIQGAFIYLPSMKVLESAEDSVPRQFPAFQPPQPVSLKDISLSSKVEYTEQERRVVVETFINDGDMARLARAMGREELALLRLVSNERKRQGNVKVPYKKHLDRMRRFPMHRGRN